MKLSANLGFLWADIPLPDAIRAAAKAGFQAVECHFPYDTPPEAVNAALAETGLPMLGLNTRRGEGENGLAALPHRILDARAAIDEALSYAQAIDADSVHVMAGAAEGPAARNVFHDNLLYALDQAQGRTILIEPLNRHDAPGYFLRSTEQACDIIDRLASPNLKLMFDCYHVGRSEGDVTTRLKDLLPYIGHIQFASVPGRTAPDAGELNYALVFETIQDLGWDRPVGAEYLPNGPTEESLDWMASLNTAPVPAGTDA